MSVGGELGELGSPRISVDMGIPMSVGGELGSPRTSVDMGIPMSVGGRSTQDQR